MSDTSSLPAPALNAGSASPKFGLDFVDARASRVMSPQEDARIAQHTWQITAR